MRNKCLSIPLIVFAALMMKIWGGEYILASLQPELAYARDLVLSFGDSVFSIYWSNQNVGYTLLSASLCLCISTACTWRKKALEEKTVKVEIETWKVCVGFSSFIVFFVGFSAFNFDGTLHSIFITPWVLFMVSMVLLAAFIFHVNESIASQKQLERHKVK